MRQFYLDPFESRNTISTVEIETGKIFHFFCRFFSRQIKGFFMLFTTVEADYELLYDMK
jgi:hypothetical protein